MMLSPESYMDILQEKNYEELIIERNNLIEEIRKYEEMSNENIETYMSPSRETIYKYNHLYLAKVSELISKKIIIEDAVVNSNKLNGNEWVYILRDYLIEKKLFELWTNDNMKQRKNGKEFTLSDHVKGLIYSLLSNQRPWKGIVKNMDKIDDIFYNFDVYRIKAEEPEKFISEVRKIKCGNRDIRRQMESLSLNIELLIEIEKEYSSMDNFVTSAPSYEIVRLISDSKSKYKIHRVGEALAWEYLRNVGIDGVKPDVHLIRFFSGERMGDGNDTPAKAIEVYETVYQLSEETGISLSEIDSLVWNFCSTGYGEICTSNPRCEKCPIKEYCNNYYL